MLRLLNFGRNVRLTPELAYTPQDEREVLEILERHRGQRIRCVGRLHSWSQVIEADEILIDLRSLAHVRAIRDEAGGSVDVGAGCQIKQVLRVLQQGHRLTLPSVGFITEQTVAGAVSTGTHGSGRHSLSHYVMSMRIARYDSKSGAAVIEEITGGLELLAARCSLGCLGVILSLRMQCRELYTVEESFGEYTQLQAVLEREGDYPLQQFYYAPWRWTYFAQHRREVVRQPSVGIGVYHWYRYIIFDLLMHLLILTVVRGLRSDRLVRTIFRWILPHCVVKNWSMVGHSSQQLVMEHELFRHVEIELFVKRAQLYQGLEFLRHALEAVASTTMQLDPDFDRQINSVHGSSTLKDLRGRYCHHYPICVRKILPDETLVSMASGLAGNETGGLDRNDEQSVDRREAWYSITLTNYQRGKAREPFEQLAAMLAQSMAQLFGARPHWGKLCPLTVEQIRGLYPAFDAFRSICRDHDPQGVFRNRWIDALLQ